MNTETRRNAILKKIMESETAISASYLASIFHVSRQIIVGDVSILRAKHHPIIATSRGYIYEKQNDKMQYIIACLHNEKETEDELNSIVDNGGIVENVIISHPIYGELSGSLHIKSRYDVKQFLHKCESEKAKNLSLLSNGIHLHTIRVNTKQEYEHIVDELNKKGYLYRK